MTSFSMRCQQASRIPDLFWPNYNPILFQHISLCSNLFSLKRWPISYSYNNRKVSHEPNYMLSLIYFYLGQGFSAVASQRWVAPP